MTSAETQIAADASRTASSPAPERKRYHDATIALHGGRSAEPTGSVAVPIYQTSAFAFDDTEQAARAFALEEERCIYTRFENPTWQVLEHRLAALERGVGALVTASGQAAIAYAVLNLVRTGDNIISVSQLYGGAHNLFTQTLRQFGVGVRWVDADDPASVERVADERTRLVYGETVGNPKLNVLDVERWAEAAHEVGVPLIVDNTIPTPAGAAIFELGADVAVHSLSKLIGGHGTSIGGAIVDKGDFDWQANAERFADLAGGDESFKNINWVDSFGAGAFVSRARAVMLRNTGACMSPFNAFLFLQGLETLALRLERHSQNAMKVAEFLCEQDAVSWVHYPGLESSPYRAIAERVLRNGFGALVTFGARGGVEAGRTFIESLGLVRHVANIGDARSLAVHSASTTHSQLSDAALSDAGVTRDMVRLSIGIEHVDDILEDLAQALAAASRRAAS